MQCVKCGSPLRPGAMFCGMCGAPCQQGAARMPGHALTADGGMYAGARIPLDKPVVMGCDPSRCTLVLPPNTPGVSRLHCTVKCQDGVVCIMDHNSTYGTYWSSGTRLPANIWVRVSDSFWLGDPGIRYTVITV